MQLSFARRLLTDVSKGRSQSLATCSLSFSFECQIGVRRVRSNANSPVCSRKVYITSSDISHSCAFVQCLRVCSLPCNRCTGNIRAVFKTNFIDTVVEVRRCAIIRSRVTDKRPTANSNSFRNVSLLQLHVGSCIKVECLRY